MINGNPMKRAAAVCAMTLVAIGITATANANLIITPETGYTITWDGNDGDNFNAAAIATAPANLASDVGTQIQSSFLVAGNHDEPGNVNDLEYGNDQSWIGSGGADWVGIDLGGHYDLTSIAWGRDNGDNVEAPSSFTDRNLGVYTVEITQAVDPATSTDWTSIGTLDYVSSDDGVVGDLFTGYFRHEYTIGSTNGPLTATGIRLQVPTGTAIDEIELAGTASALPVAETGLQSWLKADGDVVTSGAAVTEIRDHSFNGNSATPGLSPDLVTGTRDWVRFDAPVEHVNINDIGDELQDSDYEIFIVARSSSGAIQFLTAGPGGPGVGELELHLNGGNGARFIPSQVNATTDGTHPDTLADLGVDGMFTDGRAHIFNQRVEGNEGFLRVVGMENGDTVLTARSSFLDAAFGLSLGVRGDASFSFVGDMGEVLIYDQALTEVERRKVERYLARKWRAPLNVASQTQGGVAFANQDFGGDESGNPAASHEIEHLNNALYGNGQSWLGNANGTPGAYAGVKFDGMYDVSALAFGRDGTGAFTDRSAGTYTFQYTLDDFDPLSLVSIEAATWITFETIVDPGPGRTYFDEFGTLQGIMGVRVLVSDNNIAIDELEVYGLATIPAPAALPAGLALLGMVGARRRRR